MKEIISVIVPVYNVETYLPECVESLLGQTYPHLEIILIDDGSTDGSGAICDEFAARDSRIRVIHQQNGGAAAAKNAGLRIATGTYLAFLDSDDKLVVDAYAHLLELMDSHGADAVQGGFCNWYLDGEAEQFTFPGVQEYTAEQYLARYTTDWTSGLLWDKLFRRSLFDGIYFVEGNKIDDEFFTYRGMMNAVKVVQTPKILCCYRQRSSGVMLSPASAQRIVMDKLSYLPLRRGHVIERFPNLQPAFDLNYLSTMLELSSSPFATEKSLRRTKHLLRQYFREKGRTLPGKGLLFRLTVMYFTPIPLLLKHKKPIPTYTAKALFP